MKYCHCITSNEETKTRCIISDTNPIPFISQCQNSVIMSEVVFSILLNPEIKCWGCFVASARPN